MHRILLLVSFLLTVISGPVSAEEKPLGSIKIKNSGTIARTEEVVEISIKDLPYILKAKTFRLVNKATGEEIPYQLEYKGEKKPVNLLVQVSLAANSELIIEVKNEAPAKFTSKTYARYVPERLDDFAWENDRIAFRVYGKAVESTPDNASGMDVWTKRTANLILDKWYKGADYHVDHGEGLDHYKVGLTLGAGDNAPYLKDSIHFPKNYRKWEVLDNGPLRSAFRLTYEPWKVGSKTVSATKTITINAGSQLNKIDMNYQLTAGDSIDVAVGIVKRKDPGLIKLGETDAVMAYWEPDRNAGNTGIGAIFPDGFKEMKVSKGHSFTILNTKSGKLTYYNGACWDKAGLITSFDQWYNYLAEQNKILKQPLTIKIN